MTISIIIYYRFENDIDDDDDDDDDVIVGVSRLPFTWGFESVLPLLSKPGLKPGGYQLYRDTRP